MKKFAFAILPLAMTAAACGGETAEVTNEAATEDTAVMAETESMNDASTDAGTGTGTGTVTASTEADVTTDEAAAAEIAADDPAIAKPTTAERIDAAAKDVRETRDKVEKGVDDAKKARDAFKKATDGL